MRRLVLLVVVLFMCFSTVVSDSTVVCVPGQCLQGDSNITLGVKLSTSGSSTPIHLLPGEYTSTTNPQLLHDALISSSSTLTFSAGFSNSSSSSSSSSAPELPLELFLQPGLATFSSRLYSGQTSFTALPSNSTNSSTPLAAQSIVLSSNVVAITTSSSNRLVLWDSVPDTNHLPTPFNNAQLSLVDIQSTTCSPLCSSSGGTCNSQGQCVCRDGFTGSSCEECFSGRFGSKCQACADDCEKCDEGISGTGRCLQKKSGSGASACNCVNGVCGQDGSCQCTTGFTKADNGTQCAKCADGFFLNSDGDCKACQVGCAKCTDGTGDCLSCQSGSTQNQNDRTQCTPPIQVTTNGTQCPPLAFANGGTCAPCAASCQTCSGGTSNDCTQCVQGQYMLNGVCVKANGDGVCDGTSLIADNNKKACDSCGAKCTSCKIPGFSIASLVTQLQCTGCVPGSFLSQGKCVDSCPDGTFVSPQDNMTCQPCDSSCSTCSDSSTFCLTCPQNQLAFNGKCVAANSCPKSTFPSESTSSCISCHPDCSDCSDSGFNKCTSCPPERPVLSNGRCISTCSKNEYWDSNANQCKSCDSTCGSCIGPGSSSCLSCSNANDRVLRSGSCVASSNACSSLGNDTLVINPLGVCFSELVVTNTSTPADPGLNQPTAPTPTTQTAFKLQWWQILLMALGCAFIFLVFMWCCCRRRRKKREEERRRVHGYAFANVSGSNQRAWWKSCGRRKKDQKPMNGNFYDYHHPTFSDRNGGIQPNKGWKYRLIRFGEKFFGHSKSTRIPSSAIEMTVSGKPIHVLQNNQPPSSWEYDVKHRSPRHSQSSSDSLSYRDRDIDIERIASSPQQPRRMASPPAESFRTFPSSIHDPKNQPQQRERTKVLARDDNDDDETDMIQLISQYRYTINPKTPPATQKNFFHHGSRSSFASSHHPRHHTPSPLRRYNHGNDDDEIDDYYHGKEEYYRRSHASTISTDSLYSQVTGRARRVPDARQPVRGTEEEQILKSKFSMSTIGGSTDSLRDRRKLNKKRP